MRQPVTAGRVNEFMKALGSGVTTPTRIFLVGGASAVLLGWRDATIDIDLKAIPDQTEILRKLSALKEQLEINIELASPGDFIPELPGWQDRSQFVRQERKVTFLHYDFYAQALAKIERSHEHDLRDVAEMQRSNLIEPGRVLEFFDQIEDDIQNYPALNAASFRRKVEIFVDRARKR
jgi:hypothetical protein